MMEAKSGAGRQTEGETGSASLLSHFHTLLANFGVLLRDIYAFLRDGNPAVSHLLPTGVNEVDRRHLEF